MLQAASGAEPTPGIVLLVNTPRGAGVAGGRVGAITRQLAAVPGVVRTSGPAAVARDGRHVLVTGTLSASADDKSVAKSVEAAFAPDRDVTVGGTAVANQQINSTVIKDLGFAELLAFPLLIALSILFFRGRAALMPLVVGVVTVLGTFLVLTGINHVYGLSVFALNLVIGMGLGLAVDYTLFIVTRYREELAGGAEVSEAIAVTMQRAGRTVLFSAATVACALATLTLFPQGFLKSMGIAGASVALVAALSAVVVSPAMLALWGRKLARRDRPSRQPDRWYRFARGGHASAGRGGGGHRGGDGGGGAARRERRVVAVERQLGDPVGQSARTVADALRTDFGGAGQSPVTVAIRAPASDRAAVDAFAQRVARVAGVKRVSPPRLLGDSTWQVNAAVAGDPAGASAQRIVNQIRAMPGAVRGQGDRRRRVVRRSTGRHRRPPARGDRPARPADVPRVVADDRVCGPPDQGAAHECPHGRRIAGPPRAHLPARQSDRPARLHGERWRRADRLRRRCDRHICAVDGLRRVPVRTDQGGKGRGSRRAGGGGVGSGRHRPRGHRRGHPAGGRDRRVQHKLDLVHPADRRGGRHRRPAGCVHCPLAARPVADGAARPPQLVVAAQRPAVA